MLVELNTLKPGDTYNNKSYRVRDNDGDSIGIIRLSDKWFIRFYNTQINWKHLVKKDI